MAKVDYSTIPGTERQRMLHDLANFLLSVREEKDMIQVLYRLLTRSELVMLGRRLQVAEKLLQGWSYEKIRIKLKVGQGTIKAVDNWLEYAVRDYDLIRSKKKQEKTQAELSAQLRKPHRPGFLLPGQLLLRTLLRGG